MRNTPSLKILGLVIVSAGVLAVTAGTLDLGYGLWQQDRVTQEWQREVGGPPVLRSGGQAETGITPRAAAQSTPSSTPTRSEAVFALWIPKLGYYAAVRQGVGAPVLAGSPGHYPTTAWPGQPGNVGVAAHNTFWIAFDRLKSGDEIVLQTRVRSYDYRVATTRIVSAGDRTLFAPATGHRLTLTTCWPLWAGALARERLAIVADQTG